MYVYVLYTHTVYIYISIDMLKRKEWGCQKLDAGDLSDDTQLPFCDALYSWPFFKARPISPCSKRAFQGSLGAAMRPSRCPKSPLWALIAPNHCII